MAIQPDNPPEDKNQTLQTQGNRGISGDVGDLLKNFFQEGISRIVPGLVALALYAHKQIDDFKTFCGSPILFAFGIVIAAWLIGVALDIPVYIYLCLHKAFTGTDLHQDKERTDDETERLRFLKEQAEKVMCRSITIIATFTVFVRPGLLDVIPESQYPEVWRKLFSILLAFLFGFAFWWVKFGNKKPK
jgi:hypothetical protein